LSTIQVRGLRPLKGELEIQGSKNAVLPMMAASILHRGTTVLTHVPRIQDVFCMMGILEYMGCECRLEGHRLTICAEQLNDIHIPQKYLTAMRSSIMMLGALLGRCQEAETCYPGGCSIGKRPIDLHLYALRQLGADIREEEGRVTARAARLQGGRICFPFPSVGATENAILAAVLADGVTTIQGAAMEPEIEALCTLLCSMGAKISGGGTDMIRIEGVRQLQDCVCRVPGDRIVAGTYLSCVMAAGGQAQLTGICLRELQAVLNVMTRMGATFQELPCGVSICMGRRPRSVYVETGPYPGFPTDLQSPMLTLLSVGTGRGEICETIFEGRFATADQLRKMGAQITVDDRRALVTGIYPLKAASVEATDLRGGAALVAAGLAAEGVTEIGSCGHIFRGYEDICGDLRCLGAEIRRVL